MFWFFHWLNCGLPSRHDIIQKLFLWRIIDRDLIFIFSVDRNIFSFYLFSFTWFFLVDDVNEIYLRDVPGFENFLSEHVFVKADSHVRVFGKNGDFFEEILTFGQHVVVPGCELFVECVSFVVEFEQCTNIPFIPIMQLQNSL